MNKSSSTIVRKQLNNLSYRISLILLNITNIILVNYVYIYTKIYKSYFLVITVKVETLDSYMFR